MTQSGLFRITFLEPQTGTNAKLDETRDFMVGDRLGDCANCLISESVDLRLVWSVVLYARGVRMRELGRFVSWLFPERADSARGFHHANFSAIILVWARLANLVHQLRRRNCSIRLMSASDRKRTFGSPSILRVSNDWIRPKGDICPAFS